MIEDHVDIGANSTIDRATLGETKICRGVKLDNQIQIAHNVVIGENTAMAACSVVAGSTTVGKNCSFAGLVGVTGHIDIVDNTLSVSKEKNSLASIILRDGRSTLSSRLCKIPKVNFLWQHPNSRSCNKINFSDML